MVLKTTWLKGGFITPRRCEPYFSEDELGSGIVRTASTIPLFWRKRVAN